MEYSFALRFADNFAPNVGTIAAHQAVIDRCGAVWYGKFGSPVSEAKAELVMNQKDSKILLIHSGKNDRWWAHIDAIERKAPSSGFPSYYGKGLSKFHCWFHVTRIEKAEKDVMSQWIVPSSGKPLSLASRHSMSPYFFIEHDQSAIVGSSDGEQQAI